MRFNLRPRADEFYDFFKEAADNLVKGAAILSELSLPDADHQSISDRLVDTEHATTTTSRTGCCGRSTRLS
ncbi:hypothetical protein [Fodinicola feengrottensis]|uniref:hypothetical protein n=1 Tax=Fodinicola feengrottensis TaxID=435914 RepID=UPI00244125E0|nr:hypothetical protein [Fodinicola feengrottensis]